MSDFSKGAAWIDGEIVPVSEAKISVIDWGLTRSDASYDVVQVWDGAFFRLSDHLARFQSSLTKMRLSVPQDSTEIASILHAIVSASKLKDAYCAFVVTRGFQTVPGSRDPRTCVNRFFAWVVPYVNVLAADIVARGASMKIAENSVRISPQAVDPTAKNYHWGDLTAGLFEALDDGFDTVVLLNGEGHVTEGPGFNVFAVLDGKVLTPQSGVLEGITRKTVLEICEHLALDFEIRDISRDEFLEADEVFVASSGGGPVHIAKLNSRILSNGAIGPVTANIRETYLKWRSAGALRTPVMYD